MAKPSPTLSKVTSALVSMCSAVSWASPKISDSAIVKQPAWAAPISSSGFVPVLPSKRLAKPYGYLSSAPLFVEMAPLPSLMPPSQTAAPNVIIFISPRVVVALFAALLNGHSKNTCRSLLRRLSEPAPHRNGLAVLGSRNLFEDVAKLKRGILAECALEATLRCGPARTGFGDGSLTGLGQRYHTAASILFGHFELDETALLERAQKVP